MTTAAPLPPHITVDDIARKLAVSKMTVYRLINEGELRGYRIGRAIRVRADDLNTYMEEAEIRIGSMSYTENRK